MTNANDPITGFHERSNDNSEGNTFYGLTKREHFAAMAMQGMLANPDESKREFWQSKVPKLANCKNAAEFVCKSSVMMADALIKELNKIEK